MGLTLAFGPETFSRGADILAGWVDTALGNLASLRAIGPGDTWSKGLRPINTRELLEALREEAQGANVRCLIGGVVGERNIQLTVLQANYELNSTILLANSLIHTGDVCQPVGKQANLNIFDFVLCRLRALYEAFRHLSRVAADEDASRLVASLATPDNKPGWDGPRHSAVTNRLASLVTEYNGHLDIVRAELKTQTLHPMSSPDWVGSRLFQNPYPVWIAETEKPGARVINDVWMPERYATPVLKQLAEQQAIAAVTRVTSP